MHGPGPISLQIKCDEGVAGVFARGGDGFAQPIFKQPAHILRYDFHSGERSVVANAQLAKSQIAQKRFAPVDAPKTLRGYKFAVWNP